MADRFCGNCGNELRSEDRFCPGCGKPVHESAVVPTPEADVPTPPLQQTDTRTRRPDGGVAEAFERLDKRVVALLGVAAVLFIIAVVTQDGASMLLAIVCLMVAAAVYLREDDGTWLGDSSRPQSQSGYQQREPGMWSGVKIGFGIFIVLPILLVLAVIFLIALLSSG